MACGLDVVCPARSVIGGLISPLIPTLFEPSKCFGLAIPGAGRCHHSHASDPVAPEVWEIDFIIATRPLQLQYEGLYSCKYSRELLRGAVGVLWLMFEAATLRDGLLLAFLGRGCLVPAVT